MTAPFTEQGAEGDLNTWQIARIEEGVAAADRGDFASDDEMDAIFNKYATASTNPT